VSGPWCALESTKFIMETEDSGGKRSSQGSVPQNNLCRRD